MKNNWRRIIGSTILIFLLVFSFNIASGSGDDDDDDHDKKGGWFDWFDDDDDDDHDRSGHDDDDDDDDDDKWYKWMTEDKVKKEKKRAKRKYLGIVTNKTYLDECGSCHFAYQPGLLPAGSWQKIMAGLDKHFGEDAMMEPPVHEEISRFLQANSAENSSARRSRKILKSLKGRTPLRISDIPKLRHEHEEFPKRVLKRESIKSISNCPACHKSAKDGIYSERYIRIPKK